MKILITASLIVILFSGILSAQLDFPSYYGQNNFGLTSPGAMKFGLYGYDNPALLSTLHQPDIYFTWNDRVGKWHEFYNWGLFTAVPNFGFSVVSNNIITHSVTDWKISTAFGDPGFSMGLGIGWSSGDKEFFERSTLFTLGTLYRPMQYLSFGLIGNIPTDGFAEGAIDLAIRPLGNEKVALFGDYVFRKDRNENDIQWSAGVAVEPIDGIRLTGRYFDTEIFNVGVQLSFGNFGLTTQSHFDEDGDQQFNTYGIRVGAYDRNPFTGLSAGKNYAKINLYGGVKYQRFRLFDNSKTLMDLLTQIDAAKNDESVSGIAINTSGMNINRELIWELREKIVEFKKTGKNVVVFIDRAGMDEFHLASVADKIMIDPFGMLFLEGYLWGRQYYKGTLEKLGIGFHELRYFKYKSAAETFANDKMSEADKEQLQLLVDGWYEQARKDICQGRDLSFEEFDNLVDNEGIILPEDALKMGLVDTIARWNSVNDFIEKIEGEKKGFVYPGSLAEFKLPEDNYWGKKPEIAVIYAIGVCDMEEGIKARTLVDDVRSAVENDDVKAIVLRVDSPGGDALASDYIAAALKEGKGEKPIIVSQGFVAASGGYWLSMYADTIIAAPTTITGSIGVIGAFFYNESFKEEFGVSTDYVKRGKHADLGYGMRLPLFGITLPDRDFTEEELQKAESTIKTLYKDFVGKVAVGRDMQYDDIEKVAQGRVWTGEDGKERGLVDIIGGLSTAIDMAEDLSGLKDDEYEIVEYPTPGWFDFSSLMPRILGLEEQIFQDDKFIEELKFRLENNGYPMPILPMSDMDLLLEK